MGQRTNPQISAPPGVQESARGEHLEARPDAAELPVERSRFSRWLAKFGLGESTNPILRPIKRPAEKGRAG